VDNVIVVFARFARRCEGKCVRGAKAELDFEVRIWRKKPPISSTLRIDANVLSLQNLSIYVEELAVCEVAVNVQSYLCGPGQSYL
jgi:hypothetical protein